MTQKQNMITEDYVSFEVAKLLDEKQFAGDHSRRYSLIKDSGWYGDIKYDVSEGSIYNSETIYIKESIPAPTLQTAMKWLREVHRIEINVVLNELNSDNTRKYLFDIFSGTINKNFDSVQRYGFNTFEQACEKAIIYCCKHVI
jgi:hypothetical protein